MAKWLNTFDIKVYLLFYAKYTSTVSKTSDK